MGGTARFILDKDNKRYTKIISTGAMSVINSLPSLWNRDWKRFKQSLEYYELLNEEILNVDNFFEQYGTLYINWNNKEIHQLMEDYSFEGHFIPSVSLEIKGNVLYPKDFPEEYYEINCLYSNLKNENIKNIIQCYYMENKEDIFSLDNKSKDFNIIVDKNISFKEIVNFLYYSYEIEKDINFLENFPSLSIDKDLSELQNKIINFVKFPINDNNKNWKHFHYKNRNIHDEYLSILKNIKDLKNIL
tara:strand:+ start:602 stop:1339 length:738 start_codon:yes stop_codon:yes gene_type:complete